jgi:ferredoxin
VKKGKIKLIHFPENCIGCNSCVENAPDNWEIDQITGKAILKNAINKNGTHIAEISEIEVEDNHRAELSCPMRIIQVKQ